MALSDDKLWDLWNAQGTDNMSKEEAFVFARAIEAEVRKQDDALILQLVEALETCSDSGYYPYSYDEELVEAAAAAARARLAPPPPTA